MTVTKWRQVLIRVAEEELKTWDQHCMKNRATRAGLIRNAVRLYVSNPDLVNGVIKLSGNGVDITPVVDGIANLNRKLEIVEKKLASLSVERSCADPVLKRKIEEAVLRIKQKTPKEGATTVDKLRAQIEKVDPSLAAFLVASATQGICLLDEVLVELEEKGVLRRGYAGIIKFKGD